MSALLGSGKPPTTRVRRRISLFNRSIMLFYSSRLSFSCGGVGKPPFSRAGRAGGLTCGATMARLGPRYGSGRFSLRATSSRVEGDGLAGTGAAPMVSFPVCAPRSFFVLVRNNPSLRIASASQRIPVGPARRSPRTPSDKRHTNAYGCHESPFEPSINSLMHRQEVKERSWRTGAGVATSLSDRPRRTSTPSSKRDIEVPAPLAGKIREHLATYVDKKPTALLFTGVRTRGTIGDYD